MARTVDNVVLDVGATALASLATRERVLAAQRKERLKFVSLVKQVREELREETASICGSKAASLLTELRCRLEQQASEGATGYSPQRWLWYLRRVPEFLVQGNRVADLGYRLTLAESLTDQLPDGEEAIVRDGYVAFKVDESVVRHILALICTARIIGLIHVLFRHVGKGCELYFDPLGLPATRCSNAVRRSMTLFDDRNELEQEPLARCGTPLPLPTKWDEDEKSILMCFRQRGLQNIDIPVPGGKEATMRAAFQLRLVTIDSLAAFNTRFASLRWWPHEAVTLTLFLSLSAQLLFHLPNAWISLCSLGYLSTGSAIVKRIWEEHWETATQLIERVFGVSPPIPSAAALLQELRALKGSAWPLVPARPIRGSDAVMSLDIHSATARLTTALEFPATTGDVANARARHFEDEVQQAIDRSQWKPRPELQHLCRRTLRLDGVALSDIDAIAERDGTVLLVSAKSKIYTALYDVGDYAQVRNTATLIEEAVERWQALMQALLARPMGDNYDFRSVRRLIGFVCTPHVFWVPIGPATAFVMPSLRSASSLSEFQCWLKS